ncbi:MAG: BatD family protein [Woeseiaceae bacterium]|nr:BatD family protein [Woeseiaceae bacterium]
MIQRWMAGVVCLMLALPVFAEVTARVDRPTVDLNESFTLEVTIDETTDIEPDFSVLEESFYVGQISVLTNTSILNGEIQRSKTWSIALMPRTTGVQEIPAVAVGRERSNPVRIMVNEPTNLPPGEADVFVTSDVDVDETYVQAQILYRIRIYRAVATRQPALRDPTISGVEVLAEIAGDERQYEAVLNGRAYNVIERVIALYPQESGDVQISPARFEARVLRNGRITGRKVFESEAHTVNVLPIPAPPAEYPDASWLPARDVQISEEWSAPPDELKAGEPVTRVVTLSALGQIETQLPSIDFPEVEGLNIYADQPELGRALEGGGIRGTRKDQYAIIGLVGGAPELPAVEVPWWDIEAGEWRTATLPPRVLAVEGPTLAEPPPEAVTPLVPEEQPDAVDDSRTAQLAVDNFWQRAAEILAVLWILTLVGWWWSSQSRARKPRTLREPQPLPVHKQQGNCLKRARKAAVAGDAAEVRAAVIEWGRLQWQQAAPRSIGEIADRVEPPLAEQLRALSSASYGPNGEGFDGAALAQALKAPTIRAEHAAVRSNEALPPLMPPGVAS